ncbi:MAG: alpha-mannosidase [Clostridia bacterium]|nr:alpha-mannosidase [Clostridia bacterium]
MNYFINKRLEILISKLKENIITQRCCADKLFYSLSDYKKDNSFPPINSFKPLESNTDLSAPDTHYWLHFEIDTPSLNNSENELVLYIKPQLKDERWWVSNHPQIILYINGKMVQGMDQNHESITVDENTHLDVYAYCYNTSDAKENPDFKAFVGEKDTAIKNAYYDISVAFDTAMLFGEKNFNRVKILKALEKVHNNFDLNAPCDKLSCEAKKASEILNSELYNTDNSIEATVHAIGHTHIDVAWLWTLAQTREKVQRSFTTVLRLMEKYDKYLFSSSQPQLYQFLKEEAPEAYEEVKKRISEGRWEAEGAMWLEADCNLSGGESLVRQIIHGKRFMKEEFGVDSKTLWLPDVFGYSASIPQILKKCGVDNFVTSKISWNETNMLPYDTFMWQGIDGSEIFTNFLTAQDYTGDKIHTGTTYNGKATPTQILGSYDRYQQKEFNSNTSISYGWGDGGGGPTEEMIEGLLRLEKGLPGMPKAQFSTIKRWLSSAREEFFESAKALHRMPRWIGELYLEFHRGTYTSIAKNKKNNRRAEFMMMKLEALCEKCRRLYGTDYPSDKLYSMWQTILLLQFHDIIPGSSIKEVYDDSDRLYADLFAKGKEIEDKYNGIISQHLTGEKLIVNNAGIDLKGIIKTENGTAETDIVSAFGAVALENIHTECNVSVTDNIAENSLYRITLDKSGALSSIYDKKNDRELLRETELGNRIRVYEDYPYQFDNWEISNYHELKFANLSAFSVKPLCDGSRAGFEIKYNYENSEITQRIFLYSTLARIDFETEIDWQEHHRVLKTEFPLDIHTSSAKYEIQYGNVDRPTHRNTSWEAAKFEVCGHKWVDLSENGYGVSLLNNCKYGFSAEGNTLRLTMLKCGTYPNEEADIGKHSFTYSLLPHSGNDWMNDTVSQAYSLNQPLSVIDAGGKEEIKPFIAVDKSNAVIEVIKKAYDSDATILRIYEAEGRRSNISIDCGFNFSKAYLCDMLENEIGELRVDNNKILTSIKNFEILTIKIV